MGASVHKKYYSQPRLFLFLLLLLQASVTLAQGEHALLWRVETEQGAVSHLFGTIHSEDPRVLALPAPVAQAFAAADTLVLEMDLGKAETATMGRAMLLSPEDNLQSLIGEELYRQTATAMATRGYSEAMVSRMRPWAIVLTLNMPQAKTGIFLDYSLYLQAVDQGKPVRGLEQMEEQLSVFTTLTLGDQISLLRDTLREQADFPQLFERLLEAYLKRDLQALSALSEQSLQVSEEGLQQRFTEAVLDERNQLMVRRLLPMLETGGIFVAIGALHLPGEKGLLALLRQQGLRITAVY